MIQAVAAALSRLWAKNGVIPNEDIETYQYGLELLLSTTVNLAVMLGLSIAVGHAWLCIPYLASFVPLRLSAGGYHAKHHFSCILFNTLFYFASLVAVNALSAPAANLACILESCFSFAVIFLFAPVPAKNKPLSAKEQKRNRRVSLAQGFLLLILCVVFYNAHVLSLAWCKMLYCGQAAATILLVAEKVTQFIPAQIRFISQ